MVIHDKTWPRSGAVEYWSTNSVVLLKEVVRQQTHMESFVKLKKHTKGSCVLTAHLRSIACRILASYTPCFRHTATTLHHLVLKAGHTYEKEKGWFVTNYFIFLPI